MIKLLAACALALPLFALAGTDSRPVSVICNDDGEFLRQLRDEYQEVPVVIGDAGDGIIMSLLTNTKKNTWTLIGVKDQLVCVFMTGTDLRAISNKKKPPL